ncbi:poly(A)-specific ribonuclease PARN [Punica granatum]|uniref:Poly(A)-specific ribonuclease PARN n=1 Tax=Punica granatum TaxID=22663 RepID=A0A6P8E4E7_PUNGR|nr:poly(A)-specific ribonuclease PARN [Punica granatum]
MNSPSSVRVLSRAVARALSTAAPTPSTFPLKTVTRSNFEPVLESLRDHVRSADFVAVDLEMTGVTSAPWRESFEFDRHDVRYLKVKDSAEKFAVVQFGVCPFRWDSEKLSFTAHPHNFYVFPRQELSVRGSSSEFLCQTSSIDFLARYQFDFNLCIREGICYLSRDQENELFRRFNESSNLPRDLVDFGDRPLVNMADVFFTERMKIKFKDWRDSLVLGGSSISESQESSSGSNQQFQTIFYNMRPALSLIGFTAHQLRLIQLVTSKHFDDLAYVSVNSGGSHVQQLVIYIDSNADKDLLLKEVKEENHRGAESKIKAAVGFRHVIDLLSSEKKLIVGHNCFLDMAHIQSKFLGPLPKAAEEFAASAKKHFPHIIDTKVLLNSNEMLQRQMKKSSTSLSSAFALFCPQIALGYKTPDLSLASRVKVEVQVDDIRASSWDMGVKHEAGFDAFMTGCIFAQACTHLGIDFKLRSPLEDLAHNKLLQGHLNHLYLSWTSGDIINLTTGNITGKSLGANDSKKRSRKIVFENIVLLWGFPSKLRAGEIRECIVKVFGYSSVTSVYQLDRTAVFVQFSKAGLVSDFLVLKETLERNNNTVSVLNPLWKLLEGGKTRAANYEAYKEICSSPLSKISFADQAEAVGINWKVKSAELEVAEERPSREDEPSHGSFSVNEIIDSFYTPVVEKQVGSGNL